jgi:hypothetical protein
MKKSTRKALAIANLLGFLATVIINGLANALPINNRTTGAISDSYPNLFVPAGVTFSIWGIIYLLLLTWSVYQLFVAFSSKSDNGSFIDTIGPAFLVSSIANCAWIFAWHYELILVSVILMSVLLVSLLWIYNKLGIGKKNCEQPEKYLVHLPFSIYLGWITIATIANITALFVDWGLGDSLLGLSPVFWTVFVLGTGLAITLLMIFRRGDVFYSLVVIWAVLGIYIKRSTANPVINPIVVTTLLVMGIISAAVIVRIIMKRKIY